MKRLAKDHVSLIQKDILKLQTHKMNAVKILKVVGPYVIEEIKHRKPPYRLYVAIDQESDICAVVEWAHKKEQQEIIEKLRKGARKIIDDVLR